MIGICNMERVAGNIFKAYVFQGDEGKKFAKGDIVYYNEFIARDYGKSKEAYNSITEKDEKIMIIDDRHLMSEGEKDVHLSESGYPDEF